MLRRFWNWLHRTMFHRHETVRVLSDSNDRVTKIGDQIVLPDDMPREVTSFILEFDKPIPTRTLMEIAFMVCEEYGARFCWNYYDEEVNA